MSSRQKTTNNVIMLLQERSGRATYKGRASGPGLKRLLTGIKGRIRYMATVKNRNEFARAFERLSALSIVRAVPAFRGIFELTAKSNLTLMLLENSFELHWIPFVEKILKKGDHFIDVGANVGLYTILSAKLVSEKGRVLAIEPNPFVFDLLESNMMRNGLKNTILYNGVAASEPGFYKLNATEGCPEYSSLGTIVHPHAPNEVKEVRVRGETLDNLVSSNGLNPILLKIDVEGSEGLVLSGATSVLQKYRPYILSELDDRLLKELGWDAGRILGLLASYDYDVFEADTGSALSATHLNGPFIGEIVALPIESNT